MDNNAFGFGISNIGRGVLSFRRKKMDVIIEAVMVSVSQ